MKLTFSRTLMLALAAALLALAAPARAEPPAPLAPIPSLDLARYLGTWYEIARYPNRFQRQCAGSATAQYSMLPDNTVEVRNRCRRADGSMDEAIGVARQLGGRDSARLEVRFAPAWLSWLPQVWGDYWVIDLDPNYQLVAVSEPRRQYLWILARTPKVDPGAYQALLARLVRQGFDPGRLQSSATQP
ncbi:lipocalin family protein [Massilia agilis]|uniref:Outer membrane lipoprotein Blc n=1 Tax=Massilia agilis TaxID=1811226 RepID=A0ABT2DHJ3_9BURK|nr:lipocalin family protein [Massilia agilis]MCS0810770.1 lipocalin family protein [Massilia agilis]